MDNSTLNITVRLRDEASAKLEALSRRMRTVADNVGSRMTSLGTKISSAGRSMQMSGRMLSMGLTVPIAALGFAVIKTSMKFQASMELIRTQSGATQKEVDKMTKSVLKLSGSGQVGQGPEKLAEALFHIESLGYRGAKALDLLHTAADAADMGLADMTDVTNALGAAVVTGIKGTQTMRQAMGLLNSTIGAGNMTMQDLAGALSTGILPVAKSFGISLKGVGAALATLTDNGMEARQAATRLRMTMSLLGAPSKRAAKLLTDIGMSSKDAMSSISTMDVALKKSGLSITTLSDDLRKPNGILVALKDLKDHLKSAGLSSDASAALMARAFGGGRSSAALMTLMNNLDRLKTKYKQIGEESGKFQTSVEATHATATWKLNAALSQLKTVLINLGAIVVPIFVKLLKKATIFMNNFIKSWDKLSPATQKWIVKMLGLAAIIGPALLITGGLFRAFGSILKGVGGMIKAMPWALKGLGVAFKFFAANPAVLIIVAFGTVIILIDKIIKKMHVLKAFSDSMKSDIKRGNELESRLREKIKSTVNPATKKKFQSALIQTQKTQDIRRNIQGAGFWENLSVGLGLTSFKYNKLFMGNDAIKSIKHNSKTTIPANQKRGSGDTTLNFNFNNVVAGDDGIKQIIKQTVGVLNRQTSLKTMAGT